jgi:hypothetical protein
MSKEIKILRFTGDLITTMFAGKNLWRLASNVRCAIYTEKDGVLRYAMHPGFPTNMRSGSHIIDPIIPKFTRNNAYNLAILVHDFNYTVYSAGKPPVSRLLADQLLKQMALLSGELGSFRAALMYRALRIGGGSAYNEQNTGDYRGAEEFMEFRWDAK